MAQIELARHQDTGWVDLSHLLNENFELAAAAGVVQARRIDAQIFWNIRVQATASLDDASSAGPARCIENLPSQWRPQSYVGYGLFLGGPGSVQLSSEGSTTRLDVKGASGLRNWRQGDTVFTQISYLTSQPWPSS